MKFFTERTKAFFGIIAIASLFIFSSYIVRNNIETISNFIGNDFIGISIYLLISIIAIVIAPIGMTPLIPLASNLYGWFPAGLIHIIGWSIGSFIVFYICRRWGVNLVRKFVSVEKLTEYENKIPEENMFFGIIVLRTIVPVDILSYALSLFTKVSFRTYAIATVIGIIPFAFVLSYLGTVPFLYQIMGIFFMAIVIGIISLFYKKRFKRKIHHKPYK